MSKIYKIHITVTKGAAALLTVAIGLIVASLLVRVVLAIVQAVADQL